MFSFAARLGAGAAAVLAIAAPIHAAVPVAHVYPYSVTAPRTERHPEIRRAIASLQRARTAMQNANHDFGGHRADALAACDNAIAQLKLALQYDNR